MAGINKYNKRDNPFYYNYLFSKKDIQRAQFNKWDYFIKGLWLLPTYVQFNNGLVFYYKMKNNQYYFIKIEKLPSINTKIDRIMKMKSKEQ